MSIVGVTLVTAFSMGSYVIPGHNVMGMRGWPQPIGWIAQILVVESWPTYETLEIRWLALALGTLGLTGLAALTAGRIRGCQEGTILLAGLAGYCSVLVGLVAALAATSPVPELGLSWTWQLATVLVWMLTVYWWGVKAPLTAPLYSIGLAMAVLAAISLLYSLQGSQRYPNWPIGNVLLLTTACVVGIFLLGTWAYGLLVEGLRSGRRSAWLGALTVSVLLVLLAVAVSMAGRRAGVLGLLAGAGFMLLLVVIRSRRAKLGVLVLAMAGACLAAVLVPRLFKSGRWETVVLRAALYKNTAKMIEQNPLIGVGPGQLGLSLTSAMRPLHAESPRLFHGEVSTHAHSEPLHAIAEVGIPVGLLYLLLPLGGLAGYVLGYRRSEDPREQLAALGMGAALASVMAAEATSVGMRHPGVAALAWGLVGAGYACGLRSGAFAPIVARLRRIEAGPGWGAPALRAVPPAIAAVLCILAGWSMAGGYHLNNGLQAWNGNQLLEADAELDRAVWPQDADHWLMRQYLRGRVNLGLARQATDPPQAAARQGKSLESLVWLTDLCPGFKDAMVWRGRAQGSLEELVGLCEVLHQQIDPYEREGLLVLASRAEDPSKKLEYLRASLRNEEVIGPLARMIAAAAQEPAGEQTLQQWLVQADKALGLPDVNQWPDPLALETYRVAVVVHGEKGEVRQAAQLAERAATLCKYLQQEVRQRRREAVELEVYLDQAWFGWLSRPGAGRSLQAMLNERADDLIYGEAENYSGRMVMQFLAMLRLADGKQNEAAKDLLIAGGPTMRREELGQLLGLAYARLIAMGNPTVSANSAPATQAGETTERQGAGDRLEGTANGNELTAKQLAEWNRQGRYLLGDKNWPKAVELAGAHKGDPWWRGVLAAE